MKVEKDVREAAERLDKLFPDWRVADSNSHWSVTLQHVSISDARLLIDLRHGDKFGFSGIFPHGSNVEHEVSTKQSRDRPDEGIRKDVQRRLIDWYLEELPIQRDKVAAKNGAEKERWDRIEAFAKACGGRPPRQNDLSDLGIPNLHECQAGHDGTTYRLKTYNLPADLAMKIILMIQEHEAKKQGK